MHDLMILPSLSVREFKKGNQFPPQTTPGKIHNIDGVINVENHTNELLVSSNWVWCVNQSG